MSVLDDVFRIALTFTRPGSQCKNTTVRYIHASSASQAQAQLKSDIKSGRYSGLPSNANYTFNNVTKVKK